MNDTYINYIDQLLDLAERNDIFCLTSRAFNEFAAEVREALSKGKPRKPERIMKTMSMCLTKEECGPAYTCDCGAYVGYLHEYCNDCGQKLKWED